MNTADQSWFEQFLRSRRGAISENWHKAIAQADSVPPSVVEGCQELVELTDQIISLLLEKPFEPDRAEAIGASLAHLHCVQPEALGGTQEVLAHRLVEGLSPDQTVALQPRLAVLLGGLSAGYFREVRSMILAEQEQIRVALVAELQRAEEALREQSECLSILHEIDGAILAAQSPEALVKVVLHRVRRLVPCQRVSVALFDQGASEGVVFDVYGHGETSVREGERFSLGTRWDDELSKGAPYVVEDLQGFSPLPETVQTLQADGLRSCLIVPLISQGELIGSLNLCSDHSGAFAPEHVQIARELAGSLAVAIQQAWLFQSVKQRERRLRALTARLTEAAETERQRLAWELHDQVGQNLTALGINLSLVQTYMSGETTERARSHLEDSLALVEETVNRIRCVMADLRPPVLDDYGLVATLRWYGGRFASRTGIAVTVQGEEPIPRLDAPVENSLFRIAQEALNNVAKHARATRVTVTMSVDEEAVCLVIADDGLGFDPAQLIAPDGRNGWGLVCMIERAEALGGRCWIESRPQQGTRVIVEAVR
jgi:signal transduction histidine kinase